ncbi:hypothetical protein WN51_12723 [Melipona quadrifasciata]|uniref:Uncharacterized protein n=1 Tax=Melipona quadrifasciata TaxID=166423 RepID=A0A0N0BGN3_9HYME|nr:hypothetical protein WN51_12723 [Melipona quadrifasciata]
MKETCMYLETRDLFQEQTQCSVVEREANNGNSCNRFQKADALRAQPIFAMRTASFTYCNKISYHKNVYKQLTMMKRVSIYDGVSIDWYETTTCYEVTMILLFALVSTTTVAQEKNAQRSARAPQAQIKYHDPNGLNVDWKFFGALNQYRSHVQNSEPAQQPSEPAHSQQQLQLTQQQQLQSQLVQVDPSQSEHTSYLQQQTQAEPQQIVPNRIQYKTVVVQAPQPVEEQPEPNQLQYKVYPQAQAQPVEAQPVEATQYSRYSNAPARVKQVILEEFKPPNIHPDPSSYYPSDVQVSQYGQQPAANAVQYEQPEQQKSRRDYADRGLQEVPIERLPSPIPQKLVIDKNMPMEIQQLLQYQARLPYEVIANSISSRPKSLFVPKSLPAVTKGPYRYQSKVYYVNDDEYEADIGATKPGFEEKEDLETEEFGVYKDFQSWFFKRTLDGNAAVAWKSYL